MSDPVAVEDRPGTRTPRLELAKAALLTMLEQLVEERGWPDRLVTAIDLAMHEMLTRATYVAESETSVPTAALDIRRLVEAGFLTQRGAGRSTSYVASDSLRMRLANEA